MQLYFSRQIFGKYLSMKFYENMSSRSRIVHLDDGTGRWTNMTKLRVAFFAVYRTLLKMSVAMLNSLICFHDAFTANLVSH